MTDKTRIAIAGGGFAGLEAAFYLRQRLGDRADIAVVSDSERFLFRPNMIYVPFGREPEDLRFRADRALTEHGVRHVPQQVTGIDPEGRRLHTAQGGDVDYDYAVLATGARMAADEIPGLAEHAHTIWTPEENLALGQALETIVSQARKGARQRVLFSVPPGNMCSGPLYEIVLMLNTWLQDQDGDVADTIEVTFATFEPGYIMAFGPRMDGVVAEEFTRRGIRGLKEKALERVEPGLAFFEDGERLPFDLMVTLPPYRAAVDYDPLPRDARGFVQTDNDYQRVAGQERVYAIGDTADYPVKQAFLALLQADAAADAVASEVLGETPEKAFDPVSLCIMEQFDKATFVNMPQQLSGEAVPPVKVREGAEDDYQLGSGVTWRLGKKMLGIAVPMHFRHGRPFHAGATWKLLEPGLNGMKALFAD